MKTYTIKYLNGKFLWKELGEKPYEDDEKYDDIQGPDVLFNSGLYFNDVTSWEESFHSKEGWGEVVNKHDEIAFFVHAENDYIHLSEDQVRIEGSKLYLV